MWKTLDNFVESKTSLHWSEIPNSILKLCFFFSLMKRWMLWDFIKLISVEFHTVNNCRLTSPGKLKTNDIKTWTHFSQIRIPESSSERNVETNKLREFYAVTIRITNSYWHFRRSTNEINSSEICIYNFKDGFVFLSIIYTNCICTFDIFWSLPILKAVIGIIHLFQFFLSEKRVLSFFVYLPLS